MAIKSSTFGRLELSGKEAARFVEQMQENKSNEAGKRSLERGRALINNLNKRVKVILSLNDSSGLPT